MSETKQFEYNYSANRAKEIEAIRRKYEDPKTDKFEQLKVLDKQADKRGMITALVLGIVGALILGTGMSIVMEGSAALMVLGIIIGVVGIVVLSAAYPMYKKIVKEDRAKVADQILTLSKEIQ
ncbi:MAG: hypothetical protein II842_02595 [Butyrivibrio sp.]|nr:hypothetical protein [Butyrivibrio sp.]